MPQTEHVLTNALKSSNTQMVNAYAYQGMSELQINLVFHANLEHPSITSLKAANPSVVKIKLGA